MSISTGSSTQVLSAPTKKCFTMKESKIQIFLRGRHSMEQARQWLPLESIPSHQRVTHLKGCNKRHLRPFLPVSTLLLPGWLRDSKIVSSRCFESLQGTENVAEGKTFSSPESRAAKWMLFCCSAASYFILSGTAKGKCHPCHTLPAPRPCPPPLEILGTVTPQNLPLCLTLLNSPHLEILPQVNLKYIFWVQELRPTENAKIKFVALGLRGGCPQICLNGISVILN